MQFCFKKTPLDKISPLRSTVTLYSPLWGEYGYFQELHNVNVLLRHLNLGNRNLANNRGTDYQPETLKPSI